MLQPVLHAVASMRSSCDEWCLHVWEVAGIWATGLATFLAVLVSLLLARREGIRLRISARVMTVVGQGQKPPFPEVLVITVRNVGGRPATVEGVAWRQRPWGQLHAYQRFDVPGHAGPPATIEPGKAATFTLPLRDAQVNWEGWFLKDFVGRWPRIGVRLVRVTAWTPAGDKCSAFLDSSLKEWLIKRAGKTPIPSNGANMGNVPASEDHKNLYHLVYSLGMSAVLGAVDFRFLWPETHLWALLAAAALLSLIAIFELTIRGVSRRLVAGLVVFFFALAIVGRWWLGSVKTALKPLIDVTPRGLENLAPGDESGVSMTSRSAETSPAMACDATTNVQVFVAPFPLPTDYPMPEKPKVFGSTGNLAPGGEIDGFGHTTEPLTLAQVEAIADGTKTRLYVAGTLSYRLASGQACDINFLWQTGGPELVASIRAFEFDHKTKPPWWIENRFNDVTPACK